MKILVASHTYIVDLNCQKWRRFTHLEPGIEVTIVVPKRWRPGGVINHVVEPRGCQEGRFRVVPIANFSQNHQGLLCFGSELISLLRQFRPDIIQVEQGVKSLTYAQMITLNRVLGLQAKTLFFTWWNLPYTLRFPLSWLEAYNLQHSHGIVVGNRDGYDILRQRGYQGPMQIMPQLGVDEQVFSAQAHPELMDRLGIQPQDVVIGFVGRFVPEKGLRTLLQAVSGLGDRPWKLLLLGRGPLKEELTQTATALGVSDRLILVESVPHGEVYRYINLMSTLVLPSEMSHRFQTLTAVGWKEQFGHVLIEAMACRVPVIGSDSGEIPHVIGEAGLIFPEGDVAALRDRLTMLCDRPDLARELGEKGYQRAMVKYTNSALAKELLAFYRSLVP
jgi:glycosyltransferase involved in cell wall biosynthesis